MTEHRTIDDWLTLAYAGREDCPPPELFLPAEWADLDDAARGSAMRHLDACPACGAERELALAFEAPTLPNRDLDGEMETLLGRVATHREPVDRGRPGRVVRFPSLRRLMPHGAVALAAAAVVVLAASMVLRGHLGSPGLPDVPLDDARRSARIELETPSGEIAAPPATLAWREIEVADSYRVTLSAVDETVLWSTTTGRSTVELPAEARSTLQTRVVYFWHVEAFDATGARVAWSESAEFRIVPRDTNQETEPERR